MRDNVHTNLWVNNGTGGTDVRFLSHSSLRPSSCSSFSKQPADMARASQICSLFIGSVRSRPIYHGEITAIALGMDLQAWDEEGSPLVDQQGDMVICKPFPVRLPLSRLLSPLSKSNTWSGETDISFFLTFLSFSLPPFSPSSRPPPPPLLRRRTCLSVSGPSTTKAAPGTAPPTSKPTRRNNRRCGLTATLSRCIA